jgi:hypothetical protein
MPICESISFTCALLGVAGVIGSIIVCIMVITEETSRYGEENTVKVLKRARKVLIPLTVVFLIFGTIIPTESTITKMIVAQNVTYERVEIAADTVQSVYEDIMELFEEADGE